MIIDKLLVGEHQKLVFDPCASTLNSIKTNHPAVTLQVNGVGKQWAYQGTA